MSPAPHFQIPGYATVSTMPLSNRDGDGLLLEVCIHLVNGRRHQQFWANEDVKMWFHPHNKLEKENKSFFKHPK